MDAAGLAGGEVCGDHGEEIGNADDDSYLQPGHGEFKARYLFPEGVHQVEGEDGAEGNADGDSQERNEGGFDQEAELDHSLTVSDGPQHAHLLPAFDHRSQADDAEGGNANDEAHAHEPGEQVVEGGADRHLFVYDFLEGDGFGAVLKEGGFQGAGRFLGVDTPGLS